MSETTQTRDEAQTQHATTDDVDVAEGETLTVAFMDGSPIEMTVEVVTVFNGGAFTAETEDGDYVTVNGRTVKQHETQTVDSYDSESHLSYIEVTEVEEEECEDDTDTPRIEVELHNEKPNKSAESDSMWVLTQCDVCGKEGYTSEGACYDAYDSPTSPGLICKDC